MQFSPMTYFMVIIIIASWHIMEKTVFGLRVAAIGDDPESMVTADIDIWKIRHICVLICGAMAGFAGAYLSIGQLNIFMEDMTLGKCLDSLTHYSCSSKFLKFSLFPLN